MVDNSGYAFPKPISVAPNGEVDWGSCGMTYRQFLVAVIAAGMSANPNLNEMAIERIAQIAHIQADAVIDYQNEEQTKGGNR